MSPQWKLRTEFILSNNFIYLKSNSSVFSRLNKSCFLKFLSLFLDFPSSVRSFTTHSYVHPIYSDSYFSSLHLLNWILKVFETTLYCVPFLRCSLLVRFCIFVNVKNLPSISSTKQLMKIVINIRHSTNLYVALLDIPSLPV